MKIRLSRPAARDFEKLAPQLQRLVEKQFSFLSDDLRYPSLNAKKYPEGGVGVWQARVNRSYRFYFLIQDDTYVILSVTEHPK